jgi:hypothetical protein
MRAPLISSSFFCLTVLTAGALRASSLEIQNAGFEAGGAGWTINDQGMSAVVPEAARTGRFGLRVTDDSAEHGSSCRSTPVSVTAGKCYTLSFWGRARSGNGVNVYQQYFDASGRQLTTLRNGEFLQAIPGEARDWQAFTLHGQAPANAAELVVWIHSFNPTRGSADLDDFSLAGLSDQEAEKLRPQIFMQARDGRVPVPERATPAPTAPTDGFTPLAETELRKLLSSQKTEWKNENPVSIYHFNPDGTCYEDPNYLGERGNAGNWTIGEEPEWGLVVKAHRQYMVIGRNAAGELVLNRKHPSNNRNPQTPWALITPLADTSAPKAAAAPPPVAAPPPPEKPAKTDEQLAAECAQLKSAWGIYKSNSEKIRNEFQPKFDALQRQYRRSLETLKNTVQGRGDLVKTKAAVAEIERFEKMKSLPPEQDEGEIEEIKAFQAAYVKQFTALEKEMLSRLGLLTQQYEQALGRLQAERVKAGKLDEATAVSEARERAKRAINDFAEQLAALSPAPAGAPAEPAAAKTAGKEEEMQADPAVSGNIQKALASRIKGAKRELDERKKHSSYPLAIIAFYADTEEPGDRVSGKSVRYWLYDRRGAGYYWHDPRVPFREAYASIATVNSNPADGLWRRVKLDPGPPYEPFEKEVELKADEAVDLGRVVFKKVKADGTADIHGMVRDRQGNPMPDIKVSAGNKQTVTDRDGSWRLTGFGLEIVNLKAEKKGCFGGEATVEIRNMDNREIQQDLQLFKPLHLVLRYVVSAPKSDSFTGKGVAQGTLKLTLDQQAMMLRNVKMPSSSLREFVEKTNLHLYLYPKSGELRFSASYGSVGYQGFGPETPFDAVEKADEAGFRKGTSPALEKGHTVVVRGFESLQEIKSAVSEYCVKFFVEELAESDAR